MGHINVDTESAPDVVQPIQPGVYEAEIHEEPSIDDTRDKKSKKVVVPLKITADGSGGSTPEEGRQLSDHISLKMTTRLRRLQKSAGMEPSSDGFNTEDLLNKVVKIVVSNRTYQDPESGETREASNVKDYIIPGDES